MQQNHCAGQTYSVRNLQSQMHKHLDGINWHARAEYSKKCEF